MSENYAKSKGWGYMKKDELIMELEKLQGKHDRMEHLLKIAAAEINGLEVSNASARMFLGYLVQTTCAHAECDEIYVDKKEAYELLQSSYVDFKAADEENIGVILKLIMKENVDGESGVSEDESN